MSVVEFSDVVVTYDGYPALAGVSARIETGQIVLVRGENGAGKSTLLRTIAGLLPVERGTATVLGIDVAHHREAVRARIGMLSHRNGLFMDLTARDNVEFWARCVGATASDVDDALGRMRIGRELSSTLVTKLSAGQRRRVALASLVVRRAELWLLDEPHSGLDEQSRADLDAVLLEASRAGATIVVASHDTDRVTKFANSTIMLASGRTVVS
jgi:heme ABC exporter ATP-binding subunit CcmA